MVMPSGSARAVPTTRARPSAAPTTTSGTIQSTGLRYVTMSSTATTSTVTSRRRKSAPANAGEMSAWKPTGPVSCATSPSGRPSAAVVRRVAAVPATSSAASDASSGTATSAARPSSLSCGTTARGAIDSAARASARCAIAAVSASVSAAPSRLKTRIPTVVSALGNRSSSSLTCFAWLESGRPEGGNASASAFGRKANRAATAAAAITSAIQAVRRALTKRAMDLTGPPWVR